ncbi:MAG: hypothetical protein JRJ51_07260 [Deltaproteobacteria bacterium]|nr:hypothetical protein [Deltaproteobacteria bacterium]
MAKLYTIALKGKSINLPHTEHADDKGKITFDANGYATVSKVQAEAVVEFYGHSVELVK